MFYAVVDLLMAMYEPTEGEVLIDGVPLTQFDLVSWQERIGYVPQDPFLFDTTIRQNVRWAAEHAMDDDIIRACGLAHAHDFIQALPEGYDTLVGDRGLRLSGGQRQRIALARAIVRRPELLILDEATSSLDTQSERLIQQAIESIVRETTVIVIAHRLSTVVKADYIYLLEKGRILEEGTYQDLLCKNGHFTHMVELQSLETGQG